MNGFIAFSTLYYFDLLKKNVFFFISKFQVITSFIIAFGLRPANFI